MLSGLKIENVAVIEHSDIAFREGLNILTGETGAGKSIIIDSINAVLGERTSKDIVRSGCEKARVTACFDDIPSGVVETLEKYDIDCDGDSVLISRIISENGKNICRVNGCPVTVSVLREIGRNLISICGQHDSQYLLNKEHHIGFIDAMADCEELIDDYREVFYKVKAARKKLSSLIKNEEDKERRLDILRYQIDEISNAQIRAGERDELLNRKKTLLNLEKIMTNVRNADILLNGDTSGEGIISQLQTLARCVDEIAKFSPELENVSNGLNDIIYTVTDYSSEIASYSDYADDDYYDINTIESRLDVIYRLSKKYGATEEDILAFLSKAQAEYDETVNNETYIAQLEEELYELEDELFKRACYVSDARKASAVDFQNRVKRELSYLDMQSAEFVVDFSEVPATDRGFDSVEFLFSANPGQEARPLSKIASGGELSRVMLAIRCVLSDADSIPTVIFDEIDTGVSGKAAHKISYKMKELSCLKQVICVTHLAQIAAYADNHFYIEKNSDGETTKTDVLLLDETGRVNEIARIIGGEIITPTTLESARELIEFARGEIC